LIHINQKFAGFHPRRAVGSKAHPHSGGGILGRSARSQPVRCGLEGATTMSIGPMAHGTWNVLPALDTTY